MGKFHKLKIAAIYRETPDAVSILFDVPSSLHTDFRFKAGQYVTLKTSINGTEIRRAYSICSSPKSNALKVTIKAVENGLFSVFATTKLQQGDTLDVSTPEGNFILEPSAGKHYLGIAAGSGITPILSMIKAVLENEKTASFTLIYGNKSIANTIFFKELNRLKETCPTKFNIHYVFSRKQQSDCLFGRIDQGNTNYFLKNNYKNTSFDAAFLCGPEEMIQLVSKTLQENNISKENIHFELFTASASSEEENQELFDGKTTITLLLDDEETTFTMNAKDDILAAALRQNIDAPYSCQGGVCSSCLAKVTHGKAIMSKNSILSKDEVKEGFILTCQAHPTTAKITVDFDDV